MVFFGFVKRCVFGVGVDRGWFVLFFCVAFFV